MIRNGGHLPALFEKTLFEVWEECQRIRERGDEARATALATRAFRAVFDLPIDSNDAGCPADNSPIPEARSAKCGTPQKAERATGARRTK